MGILKEGKEVVLLQGKNFGKKVKIERIEDNKVFFKLNGKNKKIGIYHVFPL